MTREWRTALIITCVCSFVIGYLVGSAMTERDNRFTCAGGGFVEARPACP